MAAQSLQKYFNGVTRYGKLQIISEGERAKGQRRFYCKCDCGQSKLVYGQHLKRGNTRSCGCQITIGKTKHGLYYEPIYSRWNAMMSRCYHLTNKHYSDYGGRGIAVCKRWHDVQKFFEDMGNPPDGLSIDRIDHNGNYEPDNCRWVDGNTQARNKRNTVTIEFKGERVAISDAAEALGVRPGLLRKRLRLGWTDKDAIQTPVLTMKEASKRAQAAQGNSND